MPTTWNPADKGTGITLSDGNLTAILPVPGNQSVRSTTFKSSGKWYYEVVASWANTDTQMLGILTGSGSDLSVIYPGVNTQGYGLFRSGGWQLYFNGTAIQSGATVINDGDVIGVCLDNNGGLLYYTLNGSNLVGNPAAGTGGQSVSVTSWYAAVGGGGPTVPRSMTANFGATALAFGPPSGFTAWDTSQSTYKVFSVSSTSITRRTHMVGV